MSIRKICVDFDGVIHRPIGEWKGQDVVGGDVIPGALQFLIDLVDDPIMEVAIFSCRSRAISGRFAMMSWLKEKFIEEEGLAPDYANELVKKKIFWPTNKPAADVFIDDRAFRFEGTFPSKEFLRNFRPWHR